MRLILAVFISFLPIIMHAQSEWEKTKVSDSEVIQEKKAKPNPDAKYLEGAVPEVNGKVEWKLDLDVPGKSANEIYDIMLKFFTEHLLSLSFTGNLPPDCLIIVRPHLGIEPSCCDKLIMRALLHYLSFLQDNDLICPYHCGKTVSDHNNGPPLCQGSKGFLDQAAPRRRGKFLPYQSGCPGLQEVFPGYLCTGRP